MVLSVKTKSLIKNLAIPLIVGTLAGFLTRNDVKVFMTDVEKPAFTPPGWVFPVAWTILYILMGISAYVVENSSRYDQSKALIFYYAQLFFNFVWPFIFFSSQNYLLALIWIIILLGLIIITTLKFYRVEPKAGYLMIPYVKWVSFATVLTFSVYLLNR